MTLLYLNGDTGSPSHKEQAVDSFASTNTDQEK